MKRLIVILSILLTIQAAAQNPVQRYIDQLKSTDELREAVWGIKAMKLDGSTVVEYNSQTRMVPASNMKLITTGLALVGLGPDYRFRTRIAHSGEIHDGVLNGDLYIVGGGDPTIGDRDGASFALQELFSQWEKAIRDAGINRIEGRIIGDGRWFDGEHQNYSWMLEDCAGGDGTVQTALCFSGGLQSFNVSPGENAGDPIKVEAMFPETPWMDWQHTARTSAAGTDSDLYYSCNALTPVASLTGTLPAGTKTKRISCANCYGALTCAFYFYRYLENLGIIATEGPADIDDGGCIRTFSADEEPSTATEQANLSYIGETFSYPLIEIIQHTNNISNNFYAEGILKTLSKEKSGSASISACRGIITSELKKLGVKGTERMQFHDGSGLSRKDYVSPDFFVQYLTAMVSTTVYSDFLRSLPSPGKGTLSTRMVNSSEDVRARIFMKSGSMNGVRCYSGYILPSDGNDNGTVVFSFMTNNTVVAASRMNFIIDKVTGLLAAEN